jgi:tetratricopeptide (TPR) repeat protein
VSDSENRREAALHRCLALRAAGDLRGALAAAREACAATPDAPAAHYAVGEICTTLGDDAGAVTGFADALRRAPGWADAWVNLGLARYRQGAMSAAKQALREALRVAPGHIAATTNLGAFLRLTGETEESETLLRETLARAAQFWSSRDERAAAFAHWQEAHRLLRVSQPYSRQAFAGFIEANTAAFGAARFTQGVRAGNQDAAPVFIVGMARSGTSLCEQILAAHRDVHAAGERTALGQSYSRLGGDGVARIAVARIAALDGAALDRAAQDYLAQLHALAPDKSRIVDKMTGNELYLGLVGLMLPGARIIYCVRDPRDIGLSIFTYRFHGEHAYAHDLADLGWTIAQRARLMDHWQAVLPNPILTLALHDWVRDFDGTLARVLAHLDLPHDPACARFYDSEREVRTVSRTQVRQPIQARGLGRWRAYAAELAPLIAELETAGMLAQWNEQPER